MLKMSTVKTSSRYQLLCVNSTRKTTIGQIKYTAIKFVLLCAHIYINNKHNHWICFTEYVHQQEVNLNLTVSRKIRLHVNIP